MGTYFKNIDVTNGCADCVIRGDFCYCPIVKSDVYGYIVNGGRACEEELISVFAPHGKLISADHLKETLDYYIREAGWGEEINTGLGWVKDEFIDSETAVIEAED